MQQYALSLAHRMRKIKMPGKILYRRRLLRAVEAFLEKTPSAHIRAQRIIQRCYTAINSEAKEATLDEIVWGFFVTALTDSVYYENEQFLRETREILLGHSQQNIARSVFSRDYRFSFTADEAEWYAQLLSMVDFLLTVPFAKICEATCQARQNKENWATLLASIPEAVQAEKIDEEYEQRKVLIEEIATHSPSPENLGDEKIYHLVLREVTSVLTQIRVGKSAVYFGYPILDGTYSEYEDQLSSEHALDITGSLIWAKKALESLAGKDVLFVSWRLSKAPSFNADVLLISLH
jgi:hypothetical protein